VRPVLLDITLIGSREKFTDRDKDKEDARIM
jgi:hypothetical protein